MRPKKEDVDITTKKGEVDMSSYMKKPFKPNLKKKKVEDVGKEHRAYGFRPASPVGIPETKTPTSDEEDFIAQEWLLIPEGLYEVEFVEHQKGKSFGRATLFLHWRIVSPSEYEGTVLFQAINIEYKTFSIGTKFYKNWCLANGGKPTDKRMPLSVFEGKTFSARVATVQGNAEGSIYSKVDELMERLG
jgi:hypothetical protein